MGILVHDDVAFGWFWMALLATALVPITASLIFSSVWSAVGGRKRKPVSAEVDPYSFASEKRTRLDRTLQHRRQLWRQRIFSSRNIILFFGWICLAAVTYYVVLHTADELVSFDPYKILQIPVGSNTTDIKKAYRKLSLIYHPDKNPDDAEAEAVFIRISKAYQTLTDDATRENWEKYGNPDGYLGTSVTIALPSFLADSKHELSILIVYFFIFFIVLPILVGLWWHKSSRLDPSGTQMDTLSIFFSTLNDGMQPKFLVEVLAAAVEFRHLGHNRNIALVQRLHQDVSEEMARPRIAGGKIPYINKVNVLLHSHLLRIDVPGELHDDMALVLSRCHQLIKAMLDICLMKRLYRNLVSVIALSQSITQAVWVYHSPLTQLPHIDETAAKHLTRSKVKSLRKLLEMPADMRQAIFEQSKFSEAEVKDIETCCKILPVATMDVAFGTSDSLLPEPEPIRIMDVVTFKVRLTRLNDYPNDAAPTEPLSQLKPVLRRESSSEENYEVELINTKKNKYVDPNDIVEAHAPLFPFPKQENWVLFVFNAKKDLVSLERVSALRRQQDIDISIQMKDLGPTQFEFVLMCDSYIGLDVTQTVSIDVKKPIAPPESEDVLKTDESKSAEDSEEEEEEGYWYYLGGASFWEGLLHLFLLYVIALLGADLLEARGYIKWNPFKSKAKDPRFERKSPTEEDSPEADATEDGPSDKTDL